MLYLLYNISMKDIKVKLVIIMPLILLVILIVSFSYAYLSKEVDTNNISMNTGDKYIGVFGDNKNNIELNNEYDFNIENRGSNDAGYSIYLYSDTDIELSKISYEITGDIEKTGVLDDKNELLVSNLLKTNDKKNIKIKLTYNENQFYKGKIKITTRTYFEQQDFDFTGKVETFIVPETGLYKLETWGAQGGSVTNSGLTSTGGYGGYSTGEYFFKRGEKVYVNVGGAGTVSNRGVGTTVLGGYNGGGGNTQSQYGLGGTGGGATSIAFKSGLLSELEDDIGAILIVAGGGGAGGVENGANRYTYGGSGGGYFGNDGSTINCHDTSCPSTAGVGGSQTDGYAFGIGEAGSSWAGAAGGGYYGGIKLGGGGGGSGYIGNSKLTDKVMYCYNCEESKEESTKTVSTTCTKEEPTENCAKQGNGYARITYIGI